MNYATYSPEDNKLRLYVGRVPRDEYERLRAEGWTSTPKQTCDFVATWTPQRRDTALEYAEIIEDEDMGPDERAADRAERFSEYRDKRFSEATGKADSYDAGPSVHGYQSQARADRAASRHDRLATYACDAWSKAEYWQRRTAGVISHALYSSRPDVRMGRIKTLEAELRKIESQYTPAEGASEIMQKNDAGEQVPYVWVGQGRGGYWQEKSHLEAIKSRCQDWITHLTLRIAYENQMLEAQGGRAAFVEMEVGGWLGSRQIEKVNKSTVTGRVVSVVIRGPRVQGYAYMTTSPAGKDYSLYQIETERLSAEVYRPPTEEELATFHAARKAEKKAEPKKATIPLINPTDEDAERLQALWNERARENRIASYKRQGYSLPVTDCPPQKVLRLTQAAYSAHSKGSYCSCSTREIFTGGEAAETYRRGIEEQVKKYGRPVCQIRRTSGDNYAANRVIILTDKPQKSLPSAVWQALEVVA